MPLTLPNLDDRTYDDLVEEARSLLPVFAPDFTNHNASEPLITLTELLAYFIEILIYRLNLVTEANRRAFLRLLNGPDWLKGPDGQPLPLPTGDALDAEVRRTVLALRQTDRAVTPADFEFLSRPPELQARIARVHCIPGVDLSVADPAARFDPAPGHVSVVILPRDVLTARELDELKGDVAAYIEPRRLLTTRVHVVVPNYVPVSLQVTLHLLPDAREEVVTQRALDALTAWFDPFVGRGGAGWPFGRSVHVSEIYRLLDDLDGVDFASRSADGDSDRLLDELTTTTEFAGRVLRNADHELIGIALQPDELAQIRVAGIHIVTPRS